MARINPLVQVPKRNFSPFANGAVSAARAERAKQPRLGEMLVEEGIITAEQLKQALKTQSDSGDRLGSILVKMRFCAEEQVVTCLCRQYGIRSVDLHTVEPDPEVVKLIPRDTAERTQVLPLYRTGSTLTVAMVDPSNVAAIDDLKFITNMRIEPAVAGEIALTTAMNRFYEPTTDRDHFKEMIDSLDTGAAAEVETAEAEVESEINLERAAEEAPIVRLVNVILTEAVRRGASDIHMECFEHDFRIRYRIDGIMNEIMTLPLKLRDPAISRVKIMARLDISEKRLPQDGRIMLRLSQEGRKKILDLRVSTLPTLFGEKIVMRLLDKDNLRLDLTRLGFEPESLAQFETAIHQPYGMVLVTGPTGSGKTNTLYSCISQLNSPRINIMTAEDPVEFQLQGINQVQTKEQIGLTFAAALRAFLRQDPNIIMVGEIRDAETAEIAVKAALTGHMVLSTLHTNDAPSTISRLLNMGVEPFLVATSVNLICAQRLVRRLCQNCREPENVTTPDLLDLGFLPEEVEGLKVYRGAGCHSCGETGYKGRVGLFEVMSMDEEMRGLVLGGASNAVLKKTAFEHGMVTLRRSGLIKVKAGQTTVEEVLRETLR